jgi:hypothetical protein
VNSAEPLDWKETLRHSGSTDEERALELFYAHLTLGRLPQKNGEGIRLLTCSLAITATMRRHLVSQDPERLLIYRDLVRATFRNTLRLAMPRTCSRLGSSFEQIFEDFLAEHATGGRCLRDVSPSFLHFVRHAPPKGVPSYLWELSELEALRIVVASAPNAKPTASMAQIEPELDRGLIFSDSAVLLMFEHAVHLLSEDESDRALPERRDTHLLAYRDAAHEVRTMELTRLAARILRRLMAGMPLGPSIQSACTAENVELTPDVLSGSATVLSDLAERGALVGVEGNPSEQP